MTRGELPESAGGRDFSESPAGRVFSESAAAGALPKSAASGVLPDSAASGGLDSAASGGLQESAAGRLLAVAGFTVLLAVTGGVAWQAVGFALALLSLLPAHRRTILAVATIGVVVASPPLDLALLSELAARRGAADLVPLWPVVVAATLALGCAYVELVRRGRGRHAAAPGVTALSRYPVAVLLVLLTLLLVVAGAAPLGGAAWFFLTAFTMCLASYVWFFAFAVSDAKLKNAAPAIRQLGYWRPLWGFSTAPIGKGAAYLDRVEAKDAKALATSQRRGLRLMLWCTVLLVGMDAFRYAVHAPHGQAVPWIPAEGLPPLAAVIEAQAAGAPLPFAMRWGAVLAEFVLTVLHMTTWGNSIVAMARMAGYDIALNTDRPLLSTSIVEFYNRFYFYFKELLAAFFFYPAYLTFFRSRPKLRLFTATLAAAGFGNFLFHFLRDSGAVYRMGFAEAVVAYRIYAVYALILGVAIAVSQVRLLARHRKPPTGVRRALATAVVVSFYCLLGVLDVRTPFGLSDYVAVYVSLFVP
jgi:hypothetical protein